MLHFGCRGYKLAVLHSFGGDQLARDLMNFVGPAANDNDLQTVMFIQVNVQTGVNRNFGLVLHVCQEIAQPVHAMVIDQGNDADDINVALPDLFLN